MDVLICIAFPRLRSRWALSRHSRSACRSKAMTGRLGEFATGCGKARPSSMMLAFSCARALAAPIRRAAEPRRGRALPGDKASILHCSTLWQPASAPSRRAGLGVDECSAFSGARAPTGSPRARRPNPRHRRPSPRPPPG